MAVPFPAGGPAIFDSSGTWVGNVFTPGNPGYNILAVKVTVRIWDSASQLNRQITIMQDM